MRVCARAYIYIYKGGGIDGEGGKKSVNLIVRSFLISLRDEHTGTSGTNDEIKGCAGPITRVRPLFCLSKNLGSISDRGA